LVKLLDVSQHHAAITNPLRRRARLHDVQAKLIREMLHARRKKAKIAEHLGVFEIVLQPVADNGVWTKQDKLVQIMARLQPRDDRADNRRLTAAGDDIEQ